MKDGFIKAAAGTIDVVVADVQYLSLIHISEPTRH